MAEPYLIDTHTHVNFAAFRDDRKEVISRALNAGVWFVNIGSNYGTSAEAVDMVDDRREGVYAVVGLHPTHLVASDHADASESTYEALEEPFSADAYRELARHPKVVGIGECGLDYFQMPEGREAEAKEKQRDAFLEQIALAEELEKALVIHTRDAYEDVYGILAERRPKAKSIIIHSFTGNPEEAKRFLDLGCVIGFNGVITYKPRKERRAGSSDPRLLEAVAIVPLDRMVLETDAPYLSPAPHRGKRNEPSYVLRVAETVAALKGVPVDEVARVTTAAARAAYGI